jgi:hypothetical protein
MKKKLSLGGSLFLGLIVVGFMAVFASMMWFAQYIGDTIENDQLVHQLVLPERFNGKIIKPDISRSGGLLDDDTVVIVHRGSRRLDPSTLSVIRSMDGVESIQEEDYLVTVRKAHSFHWEEIFPHHQLVKN